MSRSRDRSWSRSEYIVPTGVGVTAEAGKIWPIPTPARSRRSYDDFGPTIMHPPENIERQEEKESGRVQLKITRHLVIKLIITIGILGRVGP